MQGERIPIFRRPSEGRDMRDAASPVLTQLRVPVERLRRRLDPATLPFQTTAEVEPIAGTVGQPRALEALEFGLEITSYGYNVYVAGRPFGSGEHGTALGRAGSGE
jgi:hypothetical protein